MYINKQFIALLEYCQYTVNFLKRNLSKYMEIWAVKRSAEDPVDTRVIGVQ